jgi:hypothetical protein
MTGDSRFVNPGALKRREWVRLSDGEVQKETRGNGNDCTFHL